MLRLILIGWYYSSCKFVLHFSLLIVWVFFTKDTINNVVVFVIMSFVATFALHERKNQVNFCHKSLIKIWRDWWPRPTAAAPRPPFFFLVQQSFFKTIHIFFHLLPPPHLHMACIWELNWTESRFIWTIKCASS